jgi:arylsulfatase A-like enzyme
MIILWKCPTHAARKFSNFEGGIRVPAFVWASAASGRLPAAARSTTYHGVMHASDWLPTLLAAAGRVRLIPRGIDGVDQWAAIRGGENATHPRDEVREFVVRRRGARVALRLRGAALLGESETGVKRSSTLVKHMKVWRC